MNASDTKPALQSKGVWGGIISALSGIAAVATVVLPMVFPDANITPDDINGVTVPAESVVLGISSIVGGILSIIGRIKARKMIG